MPQYNVKTYNGESGFLHSEHNIYAADEESAVSEAVKLVCQENGYGSSSDGGQATMATPRFRHAVTETE